MKKNYVTIGELRHFNKIRSAELYDSAIGFGPDACSYLSLARRALLHGPSMHLKNYPLVNGRKVAAHALTEAGVVGAAVYMGTGSTSCAVLAGLADYIGRYYQLMVIEGRKRKEYISMNAEMERMAHESRC